MSGGSPLESLARAILIGDRSDALQAMDRAIEAGFEVEEIVVKCVLKAHIDFGEWYERDPVGSLKAWDSCFLTSIKVLKVLESKIGVPEKPPFSVLVAAVKGEGHITTRDLIALLLKAKGLNVYNSKRGILLEDISQILSDPSLKFVILTCTEEATKSTIDTLIKGIRDTRPDVKIIAGGPFSGSVGADKVLSNPLRLYDTLFAFF